MHKPVWAYVYMILSVLFLLQYGITMFFMLLNPIISLISGQISFYWGMFFFLAVLIIFVWYYFFKRALVEIREYKKAEKESVEKLAIEEVPLEDLKPATTTTKKSSWVIVGVFGLVLFLGPGIFTLPIMPLFLAGMSTDSGTTPAYVPFLIMVVGYSVMGTLGYIAWRYFKKLMNTY